MSRLIDEVLPDRWTVAVNKVIGVLLILAFLPVYDLSASERQQPKWDFSGSVAGVSANGSLPVSFFSGDFSITKNNKEERFILVAGALSTSELITVNDLGEDLSEIDDAADNVTMPRLTLENVPGRQYAQFHYDRLWADRVFGSVIFGRERNKPRGVSSQHLRALGVKFNPYERVSDRLHMHFFVGSKYTRYNESHDYFSDLFLRATATYVYEFSCNSSFQFNVTRDWGETLDHIELESILSFWFTDRLGLSLRNRSTKYDPYFKSVPNTGNDAESFTGLFLHFKMRNRQKIWVESSENEPGKCQSKISTNEK